MDDGGFFPKTNCLRGTNFFVVTLWALHAGLMITLYQEKRGGGFTNAFSSNLNTANPKIFPKSWQDIALTNRIMEELIFELNS